MIYLSAALAVYAGSDAVFSVDPREGLKAENVEDVTLADIHQRWKQRQHRVRSFRFEWTLKAFVSKQYRRRREVHLREIYNTSVRPEDIGDVQFAQRFVFVADDNRTSLQNTGEIRSLLTESGLAPLDSQSVFDGVEFHRLHTAQSRERDVTFPQLDVLPTNQHLREEQLAPLFFAFRMLDPSMQRQLPVEDLALTEELVPFGGHTCIVLRANRPGYKRSLWVAPELDYSVLAANTLSPDGESILRQLQISYTRHAKHGWIPTGWRVIHQTRQKRLNSLSESRVTKYAINLQVPKSAFRIAAPPNAVVVDERDAEKSQISIQREGGERIPVEATQVYREMLDEATTKQEEQHAGRIWLAMRILLLCGLVIAALGLLYYRRLVRPRDE